METDYILQEKLWEIWEDDKFLTASKYSSLLAEYSGKNVNEYWVRSIFKKNGFSFKQGIANNKVI